MTAYLEGIWKCRYFWYSLVCMDLRTRYRGSIIGLGWSLLHPIAMTLILGTVFRALFEQDIRRFVPSLFSGLTLWNFIVSTSTSGCHCFFQGESYIRQYPVPLGVYPLRTMLGSAFHFSVALVLVIALGVWSQGRISVLALTSLIPSAALFMVGGWALATLFGLANVRFRDMAHLADVGFQVLFYATPIIYPMDMLKHRPRLEAMLDFNPVIPFLKLLREPVLDGRFPTSSMYLSAGMIVLFLLAAAAMALKHEERRLIFNL
jgi:ABC-type polysaccharide/polyol phosphate export permease